MILSCKSATEMKIFDSKCHISIKAVIDNVKFLYILLKETQRKKYRGYKHFLLLFCFMLELNEVTVCASIGINISVNLKAHLSHVILRLLCFHVCLVTSSSNHWL